MSFSNFLFRVQRREGPKEEDHHLHLHLGLYSRIMCVPTVDLGSAGLGAYCQGGIVCGELVRSLSSVITLTWGKT